MNQQATGELSDEKLASTIYYMITDTSGLFKQKEPLKRITSMFSMLFKELQRKDS